MVAETESAIGLAENKYFIRQDDMTRYKAIGLVQENRKSKESIGKFFLEASYFFRLLETETNQEPVNEFQNNILLRQDEMTPYNAIGLVQENFKVKYGSMKKTDRDLKLFSDFWRPISTRNRSATFQIKY